MKRQHLHTNGTFLSRGQFPERPNIHFPADIELTSSFVKFLLDGLAFFFMLPPVFVLTVLVAIPYALAGPALHEGITLLFASRTHLGRGGPIFRVGFGIISLSLHRFAERHGAELLSGRRHFFFR